MSYRNIYPYGGRGLPLAFYGSGSKILGQNAFPSIYPNLARQLSVGVFDA